MGLLSSVVSAFTEGKPDVPPLQLVDLIDQQMKTTAGNRQVLPGAEALGSDVNAFMRGERAKTLSQIPGLEDIEGGVVGNLKNWLRGDLGTDLSSQVQRRSNAQAFAGGYGGSGMGRNLTARDLGLTGYDVQRAAIPMASNYLGQEYGMRATPEFNPATQFLSPQFSAQFNQAQNMAKYQRDWLQNRINAQPDPWAQSLMTGLDSLESAAESAAGGYLGGMMAPKPTSASPSAPDANQQLNMLREFYGLT